MNTITESYPFCYAMKNGSNIDLYILVKVPSGQNIQFPSSGSLFGQTKEFEINLTSAGTNPDNAGNNYAHYTFPIKEGTETINTVEVYTIPGQAGALRMKTMKISVENMDIVGSLALPTLDGNGAALDTPYVCTKLIEVIQGSQKVFPGFDAEIYIIGDSPRQFSVTHVTVGDADKNTSSTIVGSGTTGDNDFSFKKNFEITDVHTSEGAHQATYDKNNENKGRKGKTKNKHHTVTPPPKLRFKPKQ